jgi:4-hydroxy-4-methyl-2-oxoglutarate aldolase
MAEPPVLTIKREFPRASASDLAAFAATPTGWVVDAQGRRGALPHTIRPLTKAVRAVGTALTVRSRARDNLAPYAALKFAKPGDILVVRTDDYEEASVLGDILLGMAKNAGIVAAITDGMVRDIAGLDAVGIPVFARGLTPNSPHKDGPGEIGFPIVLGGVAVAPGDLIVTDQDGVAIVPRASIAAVRAGLAEVAAKEAKMDASVRAGATRPDWLDALLSGPKVVYSE